MQASNGEIGPLTAPEVQRYAEIYHSPRSSKMQELANFAQEIGKIPIEEKDRPKLVRMNKERRKGFMRNQPCICGSKLKFKKCCWNKIARLD